MEKIGSHAPCVIGLMPMLNHWSTRVLSSMNYELPHACFLIYRTNLDVLGYRVYEFIGHEF
jgi:hypothetical protein